MYDCFKVHTKLTDALKPTHSTSKPREGVLPTAELKAQGIVEALRVLGGAGVEARQVFDCFATDVACHAVLKMDTRQTEELQVHAAEVGVSGGKSTGPAVSTRAHRGSLAMRALCLPHLNVVNCGNGWNAFACRSLRRALERCMGATMQN